MSPIIIDIDQSVKKIDNERRIDMRRWHATVRYGCSWRSMDRLVADLQRCLPKTHGPVLIGSGDFHHLSLPLIARHRDTPMRVVVFDNHPDNMRTWLGLDCGSWVSHVAALPHVVRVDVVGMTSADMTVKNAWQHRLSPLIRRKLTYWTIGVNTRWFARVGLGHAEKHFHDADQLLSTFCQDLAATPMATYLSIDKDVLRPDQVQTNWDQGEMTIAHLLQAIEALQGRVVSADITGEISSFRYPQWYKRLLSAMDGQGATFTDQALLAHQAKQHQCNLTLIAALNKAWVP